MTGARDQESAVEAVLFDYSGVLTTSLRLPEIELGFDKDALAVEMIAALAGSEPHPWHELERGEISLELFSAHVESRVAGAGVVFDADHELNVMARLELLPERIDVVRHVKARGLRTGVVTNNVAEWQPHWLPRLEPGLFDVVIDSATVGARKPEPEIYELALERLGVAEPDRVVFIDDFEWNVVGAEAVGMIGVHCTAETDLAALLADLLG